MKSVRQESREVNVTFALPAISFPAIVLVLDSFTINIRGIGRSKWPLIGTCAASVKVGEAAASGDLVCADCRVHFRISSKGHGIGSGDHLSVVSHRYWCNHAEHECLVRIVSYRRPHRAAPPWLTGPRTSQFTSATTQSRLRGEG